MTRNVETGDPAGRSASLIVGFFRNREDADRAIEELREVEIPASDITTAWRGEGGLAPFDSEVNPGLDPEAAYDPTTYPAGPETSQGGGSPFTRSEEELSWEKAAGPAPAGVRAVDLSNAKGDVPENSGNQDPADILRSLGLPPESARILAPRLSPGGAVVCVRIAERAAEVREILERNQGTTQSLP